MFFSILLSIPFLFEPVFADSYVTITQSSGQTTTPLLIENNAGTDLWWTATNGTQFMTANQFIVLDGSGGDDKIHSDGTTVYISQGGNFVSLPSLSANATFVLNDTTQTLTSKTFDLTSNTLTGSVSEFNTALESDSFVYLGQANSYGDFLQTFKDDKFKINSPDDADGVTIINSDQTAERNLTIPVLTGDRNFLVSGEGNIVNADLASGVFGKITGLGAQSQNLNMNDNDLISASSGGSNVGDVGTPFGQIIADIFRNGDGRHMRINLDGATGSENISIQTDNASAVLTARLRITNAVNQADVDILNADIDMNNNNIESISNLEVGNIRDKTDTVSVITITDTTGAMSFNSRPISDLKLANSLDADSNFIDNLTRVSITEATAGTNANMLELQKAGSVSASNIQFFYSHRSSDTEMQLLGWDNGAGGFKTFYELDYPNNRLEVKNNIMLPSEAVADSNAPSFINTPSDVTGAQHTWLRVIAPDGDTVWIPAWK